MTVETLSDRDVAGITAVAVTEAFGALENADRRAHKLIRALLRSYQHVVEDDGTGFTGEFTVSFTDKDGKRHRLQLWLETGSLCTHAPA